MIDGTRDASPLAEGWLRHQVRLFFVAVQFLTRVPVPAWATLGFQPAWLNACVIHFPLVGACVGVVGALVLWGGSALWPAWVAAVLTVAATVALTGAFHEDGLADTFDALGGHVPRERALEIMKDSRIGTYGAAALSLSLLLRVMLLAASINVSGVLPTCCALVAAHALGRTAAVVLMRWLPYAGDAAHAKAKPLATSVPTRSMAWAVITGGLIGLLAATIAAHNGGAASAGTGQAWRFWAGWASVPCAVLAVAWCMRRWLQQRLGGYTGDTLGATVQLTEIAVLLALSAGLQG
jgi:adenosylcobinamide-GDP ribazoletransferase